MFKPAADEVKAWAESGRSFEPTDWECDGCRNFEHYPAAAGIDTLAAEAEAGYDDD